MENKIAEWRIICTGLWVFALLVGVFGYFFGKDKDAIAVAFVLMTGVAGVALWKAGKAKI